jgi:PAS domain S-box-containing protein
MATASSPSEDADGMRDLMARAPFAYHLLDGEGRFLAVNDTAARWLGQRRDRLRGQALSAYLSDASARQFETELPALQDGRVRSGLEFDLLAHDGSTRRVGASIVPMLDAQGRCSRSHWVLHDLSELHAAREQAQRLLCEQSAILDNELVGLVRVHERRAVWHNRALAKMLGYAPGELVGSDSRRLHADENEYLWVGEAAYPLIRTGGVFRTQLNLRRKDGSTIWVDLCGMAIGGDENDSLWSFVDLTAIRQAETLRVRSAELAAENRQLRELARVQRLFGSNMAHELRTPLNGIIGMAHLLLRGGARGDESHFDRYLASILGSAQKLLGMVDRILDVNAAEMDQLPFHPEALSLTPLVDEVIALQRAALDAKGLDLRVELDPALTGLQFDPLRFKQVLQAYLDNAIHFTAPRGHIVVRARALDAARLRLEVEDDGIGIAVKDLPLLFTKYRQLSEGLSKTHPGLGLSLALTRRIVEAQGGSVGVRSRPGEGSVFHADLPRFQWRPPTPPA